MLRPDSRVGISGKWDGKDAQLAPTEIWCKESDAQKVYENFMKMNGKTVTAEVVEVKFIHTLLVVAEKERCTLGSDNSVAVGYLLFRTERERLCLREATLNVTLQMMR